jgi:hypothetical protein
MPLFREAAWELWPKEQQRALHLECACFLQDLACRCESCHREDFVPFHRFAVYSTKSSSETSRLYTYKETGSVLTQVTTNKLQLPSPQGKLGVRKRTCVQHFCLFMHLEPSSKSWNQDWGYSSAKEYFLTWRETLRCSPSIIHTHTHTHTHTRWNQIKGETIYPWSIISENKTWSRS